MICFVVERYCSSTVQTRAYYLLIAPNIHVLAVNFQQLQPSLNLDIVGLSDSWYRRMQKLITDFDRVSLSPSLSKPQWLHTQFALPWCMCQCQFGILQILHHSWLMWLEQLDTIDNFRTIWHFSSKTQHFINVQIKWILFNGMKFPMFLFLAPQPFPCLELHHTYHRQHAIWYWGRISM